MLLEKGVEINARGGQYGSALYAAITQGTEGDRGDADREGADVNAQGGEYENALQAAIEIGSGSL